MSLLLSHETKLSLIHFGKQVNIYFSEKLTKLHFFGKKRGNQFFNKPMEISCDFNS